MRIYKKALKSIRIMIFQGSARNKYNCPDEYGKTRYLIEHAIKNAPPDVFIDPCDLSIDPEKPSIGPCKACVSTAGGFHCHWKCSCYSKGDKLNPDLMYDDDIYDRLEKADGFIVYTPVNWFGVPTQVKAMFDRLVCINLTITKERAKKLGCWDHGVFKRPIEKYAEVTRKLEQSGKYDHLLKNHFAGKTAAFFIHGDGGANDYHDGPFPDTFNEEEFEKSCNESAKSAIMPFVWQCRYSAIDVPDDLVKAVYIGKNVPYSVNNDRFAKNEKFMDMSKQILWDLVDKIKEKSV